MRDVQTLINDGDPIPQGTYVLDAPLTVPAGGCLIGDGGAEPGQGPGTELVFTPNAGTDPDGPAYIRYSYGTYLSNFTISRPAGTKFDTPGPWALSGQNQDGGSGTGAVLERININCTWRGVALGSRQSARLLRMQCFETGMSLERAQSMTFLDNIILDQSYDGSAAAAAYMLQNTVAFRVLRADQFYASDLFVGACKVAYQFGVSPVDGTNSYGQCLNLGTDNCLTAVQIDSGAYPGLLFSNCMFGSNSASTVPIVVTGPAFGANRGCAYFSNTKFRDTGAGIIQHQSGHVSLANCSLDNCHGYAIETLGGTLACTGSDFTMVPKHFHWGPYTQGVVVTGNMARDGKDWVVNNEIGNKAVMANNSWM